MTTAGSKWKNRFEEPVSKFAQNAVIIYPDDAVEDAAKLMCEKQVGSVVVAERLGEPIGMVTEWDLVSRVLALGKIPGKTLVREVMSSPLVKIEASSRIEDALRLMAKSGVRRLAVYENGALVGILTQNHVIGNSRSRSSKLPIVEPIRGHMCIYCNMTFQDIEKLEEHINSTHRDTLNLRTEELEQELSE